MDPSSIVNAQRSKKQEPNKLKFPRPDIIKKHNSHLKGMYIRDHLKAINELDRKLNLLF